MIENMGISALRDEIRVRRRAGLLPGVTGTDVVKFGVDECRKLIADVEHAWNELGPVAQRIALEAASERDFHEKMAKRPKQKAPMAANAASAEKIARPVFGEDHATPEPMRVTIHHSRFSMSAEVPFNRDNIATLAGTLAELGHGG